MCLRNWRSERRNAGFTLIEALVGLALLGGVLATALVARAQYTRQLAEADRRLEAVEAADQLLTDWWSDPARLPRHAQGAAPGNDRFTWQTRTKSVRLGFAQELSITTLEICDARTDTGNEPVLAVEVLLPGPTVRRLVEGPSRRGGT